MWQELKRMLLDIFYPRSCPGCGTQVQEEGLLCPACRAGLLEPRTVVPESVGCRHLDGLFFLFHYEGGIREGLHQAKFGRRREVLAPLAYEWARGMEQEALLNWGPELARAVAVVPIPTDEGRRKERGYDIPEEIFRGWCGQRGFVWLPVLRRMRPTLPQYALSVEARKENIRGSLGLVPGCSVPPVVVLADDIVTSGTTVEEAARVLKAAGAERVYAVALASGMGK